MMSYTVLTRSTTDRNTTPGAELNTFMAFLQYLYTDHWPIEEGEATMGNG